MSDEGRPAVNQTPGTERPQAPAPSAGAATEVVPETRPSGDKPKSKPAKARTGSSKAPVAAPPRGGSGTTPRDRTGTVRTSGNTVRPARKARLRIAKLDPWSVMKTALMFSIAAAIITFVAVGLLWSVIEASGALEKLQETLNALLGNPDGSGQVQVSAYVDRWRVLGFTAIVAGANVILLTALATLGAFLYNLSSSVLGGLEVTLAED